MMLSIQDDETAMRIAGHGACGLAFAPQARTWHFCCSRSTGAVEFLRWVACIHFLGLVEIIFSSVRSCCDVGSSCGNCHTIRSDAYGFNVARTLGSLTLSTSNCSQSFGSSESHHAGTDPAAGFAETPIDNTGRSKTIGPSQLAPCAYVHPLCDDHQ